MSSNGISGGGGGRAMGFGRPQNPQNMMYTNGGNQVAGPGPGGISANQVTFPGGMGNGGGPDMSMYARGGANVAPGGMLMGNNAAPQTRPMFGNANPGGTANSIAMGGNMPIKGMGNPGVMDNWSPGGNMGGSMAGPGGIVGGNMGSPGINSVSMGNPGMGGMVGGNMGVPGQDMSMNQTASTPVQQGILRRRQGMPRTRLF